MDIPIELFLGFTGVSIVLAIFGFLRNPQIPATIVMGGMFLLVISVATSNIVMNDRIDDVISTSNTLNVTTGTTEIEVYSYSVITGSTSQSLRSDGTNTRARAEFVSNINSTLIDDLIECIRIPLFKTGSPTGTAVIGTLDGSSNPIMIFGYINLPTISTMSMPYEFCLDNMTYQIQLGDRIGIRILNGSQDASNFISSFSDNTNPFDGTNTFRQGYGTSWVSATNEDMNMQLYRIETIPSNVEIAGVGGIYSYENNLYEFTELPKTLFALIGVMIMLVGGLMVMRD